MAHLAHTAPRAAGSQTPDVLEVERWLRTSIAAVLGVAPSEINVHKPIATYGVDSAEAAGLVGDLETWLECPVPVEVIWEWASTREVAQRVVECLGTPPARP